MLFYVVRRLLQALFVMVSVACLAFVMFQYLGNPVDAMVGLETTLEQRRQLAEELGLNKPVLYQFWQFLENTIQGNFGNSYVQKVPVVQLLKERLPATLELALFSAILSILIGIPLGVYSAIARNTLGAAVANIFALCGVAIPTFVMGLGFIMLFGVYLGWLPSFGRGEVEFFGGWSTGLSTGSGIKSILLPGLTLAIFQMTFIMRLTRAEVLEVLQTDFIKFARARGLKKSTIYFSYALKNALIPAVTIIGLQLGGIIAFAIITETVFQWPGMGLLFIQAVQNADIPVMSAYLILIALLFVLINLTVDLCYPLIDPRLRK